MKRIFAVLLLIFLMLQTVSCVHVKPSYHGAETETERVEETTALSQPSLEETLQRELPTWTKVVHNATAFLQEARYAIVDASDAAYSYSEMEEDLRILSRIYPQYFSHRSIGKSVAGRQIYLAVLGNPDASRQILVSAGMHGREYLTPLLVMKQIEFMLAYLGDGCMGDTSYASILDQYCF